jgi:trehalose 6-phosphate phosphatase
VSAPGSLNPGAVAARAAETALCLDFDGTLAPIVPDPEAAVPLPGVPDLLGRLAGRFAAVALVSGRPARWLAGRVRAQGVRYLGLYGAEELLEGHLRTDPAAAAARPAVRTAREELAAAGAVTAAGAYLEDKDLSVVVHLRRVADPERWAEPVAAAVEEVAARHGLDVLPGKLVWELRPETGHDKGVAVRLVLSSSGASALVVVGDDVGDLAAFRAAEELVAMGGHALRVAVRSAEAPGDLLAAADLVVDGPEGVRDLLASWAGGG